MAQYDTDLFGSETIDSAKFSRMEVEEGDEDEELYRLSRSRGFGPSRDLLRDTALEGDDNENDNDMMKQYREKYGSGLVNTRIADRESDYQKRRTKRSLSPSRGDAFATGITEIGEKKSDKEEQKPSAKGRRRRRWDDDSISDAATAKDIIAPMSKDLSRWDQGPITILAAKEESLVPEAKHVSRWDQGPEDQQAASIPPPNSSANLEIKGWELEMEERNRPWRGNEFEKFLPEDGYTIVQPPEGYKPAIKRSSLTAPSAEEDVGFSIQDSTTNLARDAYDVPLETPYSDGGALPSLKPEDYAYFGKLVEKGGSKEEISEEEVREKEIMTLLLKIKNGNPAQRKVALRAIADKATHFGAEPLFNQILPLLMTPTLEDQERHLLVKVIDRVLNKLNELVRPFVHKILVVIEPLLIDEDYYARMEGREIISNLSKAAGLASMISTLREDIDNADEYVRNTTSRAFAVVASALGIPNLLPFLKAVCQSKKSWEARHTGIKIVQQIAILMGASTLPHLKTMVSIIQHGLTDDQQKIRTITALALGSLAQAAYPYGIEAFESILRPLWLGVKQHRQKALASFLKAIGYIIPLMEEEHANHYTKDVMVIVTREFSSPDEEMKKVVLKVVQQCVMTDGVDAAYVKEFILPEFFKKFWVRRMALDRRNSKAVVETTVELSNKTGSAVILEKIVDDLKDESEPYRAMVLDAVENIISNLGAFDVNKRLEEQIMDGLLYVFQEQSDGDSKAILNSFGSLANSFSDRMKTYLPQVCGTIKWRLNNQSPSIRMQAADLVAKVSNVMKVCDEDQLMGHLGVLLYENLGEEYPDVLGSILGALTGIVSVIGMPNMTPSIKDLLPRLTPILKNRHEKVQENCINLVGKIADRGAEYVSAREWIRICFELLDMLKAKKKSIRRAAVSTFGYIAKAIGPQDVLHTLLSNLRVQERQMRVCTTVAIAIVAETCAPFTILPALMNEYRTPDVNIQNGVLKALSFMFEYIGELGKDYVYAVAPLLEDALIDRDHVHRQTAASAIKHIALGAAGEGCEDVLGHLLNYLWPNIFEESPHVINATVEAIEGLMVALGVAKMNMYVLQGLFHPARRVRDAFWRIYNTMYVWNQDAMVASFPRIEDEKYDYRATQLELLI